MAGSIVKHFENGLSDAAECESKGREDCDTNHHY
jgi:hypothetical protein